MATATIINDDNFIFFITVVCDFIVVYDGYDKIMVVVAILIVVIIVTIAIDLIVNINVDVEKDLEQPIGITIAITLGDTAQVAHDPLDLADGRQQALEQRLMIMAPGPAAVRFDQLAPRCFVLGRLDRRLTEMSCGEPQGEDDVALAEPRLLGLGLITDLPLVDVGVRARSASTWRHGSEPPSVRGPARRMQIARAVGAPGWPAGSRASSNARWVMVERRKTGTGE